MPRFSEKPSPRTTSIKWSKARFEAASYYPTVAARSARFTSPAISSASRMATYTVSRPKPSPDTTLRLVERQSLERVTKTDPAMVRALLTMTTDNLQHVENHMLLLGRKTSRERVAAFLLEMNGRLTAPGGMALPMSRRDIADYLGLTLETVSRALSEFNRRGYLQFLGSTQRQIVVLKPAGLSENR